MLDLDLDALRLQGSLMRLDEQEKFVFAQYVLLFPLSSSALLMRFLLVLWLETPMCVLCWWM